MYGLLVYLSKLHVSMILVACCLLKCGLFIQDSMYWRNALCASNIAGPLTGEVLHCYPDAETVAYVPHHMLLPLAQGLEENAGRNNIDNMFRVGGTFGYTSS